MSLNSLGLTRFWQPDPAPLANRTFLGREHDFRHQQTPTLFTVTPVREIAVVAHSVSPIDYVLRRYRVVARPLRPLVYEKGPHEPKKK